MNLEPAQIHALISGCKNDDRKSQEQLYRSFYRVMMNLCLRYTRNEQDALEVLNSGFYNVFKNIHKYDASVGSLYTWIRSILVNRCLDHLRSRQQFENIEDIDSISPPEIQPEVIARLDAASLLSIVRTLPPATQAVFNLFVLDGYSHKEIAAMAGISEGTSKWHLNQARKKMKEMISNQ